MRRLATDPRAALDVAADEDFWSDVARAFRLDRSIVNLNNGGVSPTVGPAFDAHVGHLEFASSAPSWALWRVLEPRKEVVRDRMARQWGIDPEELAFTRNASEGLQICQFGFDLEAGDEVLTTNQDYPRMLTTFRQREEREGVVLRMISLPVPSEDDAEIVRRFEEAIGPRTKLILCCHMINLTGQILPVSEITALGRRHGIPVIVDGAHALAHFDFRLDELDVDYYATSLHKWLFAPIGTGLLYVRRERIGELWPLMAAEERQKHDIRKFEQVGTHPVGVHLAVGDALTFHQALGPVRKAERLRFLRDLWATRLESQDRITLRTSLEPGFACGIATFDVEGLSPVKLSTWLWTEHRMLVSPIVHSEFQGVRVSPSVYSTVEELERFCEAIEDAILHGV